MFHAELVDIIIECITILLVEETTEISSVGSHLASHIRQLQTRIQEYLFLIEEFSYRLAHLWRQLTTMLVQVCLFLLFVLRIVQLIDDRLMPIDEI